VKITVVVYWPVRVKGKREIVVEHPAASVLTARTSRRAWRTLSNGAGCRADKQLCSQVRYQGQRMAGIARKEIHRQGCPILRTVEEKLRKAEADKAAFKTVEALRGACVKDDKYTTTSTLC